MQRAADRPACRPFHHGPRHHAGQSRARGRASRSVRSSAAWMKAWIFRIVGKGADLPGMTSPPPPEAAGASQGASPEQENTGIPAHPRVADRADRGPAVLARRAARAREAGEASDPGGGCGDGDPRCARPRRPRTRRGGGTRPAQRPAGGAAENGRGDDRLRCAADRRPRRALPRRDPAACEGSDGALEEPAVAMPDRGPSLRDIENASPADTAVRCWRGRPSRSRATSRGGTARISPSETRRSMRSSISSSAASPRASGPASGASRCLPPAASPRPAAACS